MAGININDLTKKYESPTETVLAVKEMDIDIENGEFLVLVGPSGCGKSTTLRCIAGLEDVTEGSILFGDHDVTDRRAAEREVAMVFQNYALYPHMTARQNMAFGLKLSTRMSSAEIDEKVVETAEMMGIEELLDDKPKELSGGQQQRVALGRAIVREPEVFLMDEPLSNLDAKLRAEMRTELQELQQRLGVTTIYVTHDQTEAMAMGDRIAVINEGVLQQIGEPEEIYRSPNNEFVAQFIGSPSINLFDASVDGRTLTGPGGFEYELDDPAPVGGYDDVRVGIRPEDITLESGAPNSATVNVVERMGNENFLYMELGGRTVNARVDSAFRPEPGQAVGFTFDEESLYLFDPASGESLKTKTGEIETGVGEYILAE
jgi:multiple sugar transport system ATP-binding protein